jgi:hypothetical protein
MADAGHWITTKEGNHVLIKDPIGSGKGFTRAALHRKIMAHHEEIAGGTRGIGVHESQEFENAGSGYGQTTFHKKLPGEVRKYLEGNPSARKLFRVTQQASEAGGDDAMRDLGDKYFSHIDAMSGNKIEAAIATARKSPDPEIRFAAMIHDNMPSGRNTSIGAVEPGKLRVGQKFTAAGMSFRVVEDEDGHKVLAGEGEHIPMDALKSVPVDRGSLSAPKRNRIAVKADNVAPFSRTNEVNEMSDENGEWRTINGAHVMIGKGGLIEKGPAHMVGKSPQDMHSASASSIIASGPHHGKVEVEDDKGEKHEVTKSQVARESSRHSVTVKDKNDSSGQSYKSIPTDSVRKVIKDGRTAWQHPDAGSSVPDWVKSQIASRHELSDAHPDILWLSAPRTDFADLSSADERPLEIMGQPVVYKWKDLIEPGEYENRGKGFHLSAPMDRLLGWASTGRKMVAAGVDIPINVDHSNKAEDVRGYVKDFRVDGGRLLGLCQLIGADAVKEASRNRVSIGVPKGDFIDGTGRNWGDAIVHVALTPVPVVPNQNDFQAASRAAAADVLTLAAATTERSGPMADSNIVQHPSTPETRKSLCKQVPGLKNAAHDDYMARIDQHMQTCSEMDDDDAGSDGSDVSTMSREEIFEKASENRAANRKAAAKVKQLEAKVQELSRTPAPIDPDVLKDRAELATSRVDLALTRGEITPSIARKLKAKVQPEGGKPSVFMLSRASDLADERPVDFVLSLFKGEKLTPVGEGRTGVQTLARVTPHDEPDAPAFDPKKKSPLEETAESMYGVAGIGGKK